MHYVLAHRLEYWKIFTWIYSFIIELLQSLKDQVKILISIFQKKKRVLSNATCRQVGNVRVLYSLLILVSGALHLHLLPPAPTSTSTFTSTSSFLPHWSTSSCGNICKLFLGSCKRSFEKEGFNTIYVNKVTNYWTIRYALDKRNNLINSNGLAKP